MAGASSTPGTPSTAHCPARSRPLFASARPAPCRRPSPREVVMLFALAALLTATVVAAEPTTSGAGSHGAVAGTVTLTDTRGERFDAPGAELVLACGTTPDEPQAVASDDHGVFRFADVRPGRC